MMEEACVREYTIDLAFFVLLDTETNNFVIAGRGISIDIFGQNYFWTHDLAQGQGKNLDNNNSKFPTVFSIYARRNPQ